MTRLIDADAFRREIDTYPPFDKKTQGSSMMANFAKHMLLDALNNMPTIDAEPVRHGKWIRKHKYGSWECSVCGCKVNRTNPLKGNIWNYYYCPNCGARVDKE